FPVFTSSQSWEDPPMSAGHGWLYTLHNAGGTTARREKRSTISTQEKVRKAYMRGSKQDLPVAFDGDGVRSQQVEWGEINAALESFPAGLDTAPLFKGL